MKLRLRFLGATAATLLLVGVVIPITASAVTTSEMDAARDTILDGVTKLADPNGPGRLVVWGEDAFSVANYQGQDRRDPMIAAANWGSGRVIALGDHQFLNMNRYGDSDDNGQFYLNAIEWLSGTTDKNIKIVVTPHSGSDTWLAAQGFTNVVVTSDYATHLTDADVVLGWFGSRLADADIDAVKTFVTSGGGLFVVDYGIGYRWWWGLDLPDAPGNRLLRDAGIGFVASNTHGLSPARASGQTTLADFEALMADRDTADPTELAIAIAMADRLYTVLPDGDPILARLDVAYASAGSTPRPTPSNPISSDIDKALLNQEMRQLLATAPADVVKHPTAEELYGAVPTEAPRVTATVSIDTSIPRWHATGLFVAPGEVVTVQVPDSLVGKGYRLRVNAHTDNISRRDSWERPPSVHRSYNIDANSVDVANAFGGLLFVDLGGRPTDVGVVDVTVTNAVEAPYFVLSEHTNAEWNTTLRHRPAPFAILVSPNMMISVPKSYIESANLTQAHELMAWWNDVVGMQDDLAAQTRTSAELANTDVQISVGAAHSGYPYQAYAKHWGNMVDYERLIVRGSWGDFHELGHNHQRGWWTFFGDTEVSVNIFSNISMEQMASAPQRGWTWSTRPEEVLARAINDVSRGGTYSNKSDRWSFWFQLADGFGWDAYRNVFAGYEEDKRTNPAALPQNEAEKRDQWLVRFSNEVGHDMSPFMVDIWGLEVSAEARAAVSHLPGWEPLWTEPLATSTSNGEPVTIDLSANIFSMTALEVAAVQPAAGSVSKNSDGTFTYSPAPGFVASEQLTFIAQTAAGNTAELIVSVDNTGLGVAPVATPGAAEVDEDDSVIIDVLANVTDVDDDLVPSSLMITTTPAGGQATVQADNTIKFVPSADVFGSQSLAYVVCDSRNHCTTANVAITVRPVNDAPVAKPDAASVRQGGSVDIAVLTNDTDIDTDHGGLTARLVGAPSAGSIELIDGTTFRYTAAAEVCVGDNFLYAAFDGQAESNWVEVTFDVECGLVAPTDPTPTPNPTPTPPAPKTPPGEPDAPAWCRGKLVTINMNTNGGVGTGGPGNDVILGTPNADIIDAGDGDNTICSGGGDDHITTGSGRDRIWAGDGNDTVFAGLSIDYIYGGTGIDTIHGEGGSDRIRSGPGNDIVKAGSGADRVWGGEGADDINGQGGKDTLFGGPGNDVIQGSHQSDKIYGGDGNDDLRGAGGRDRLFGDDGDDELAGGNNSDWLEGGPGIDIANGQRGRETPFVHGQVGCLAEETVAC